MEEYLQYMKTLRSQMNDVEDQAAKISFEGQMLITTIQTMEKDIRSAKTETRELQNDTDQMRKTKGQICWQILEKQRKISYLESDSLTLAQTLELIQQERVSLSDKLVTRSSYHMKVAEDLNTKFQHQQDWLDSRNIKGNMGQQELIDKTRKNLMELLYSAKAKLDQITQMRSKLVLENSKMKQSIEQIRCKINDFKTELQVMDIKALEEEYKALLLDQSGETDYLRSLQYQIQKLKGISHIVKCGCGEEYKVEINRHA